ncbi:bacteriocin [Phocaeicola barnesiae]|uniref:bacteriocin n=1 Tax=Phocaeicola barnesiae TaxID=376804 RepID=UPI0025A32E5B|nr:bacteriocin [Phocaeicola barnesiae]MDM8243043.1 bacteriocin [Phocaeicola barnesiae]MDM8243044.1 bacteriocin [Phocaeicola barnesiae]
MKKEELIKVEEELSNEKLAQIIGGVSSSKISVTFSMASQSELSEASSGKDKDSDADESLKIVEPLK